MNTGRDLRRPPWRQVVLWASLALLLTTLLVGCTRSVLYSHLDERQANEVVAALIEHGISARKQSIKGGDGWQVLLGSRQNMPKAMAVLHNAGLPHKSADISAFFKKQGFVSSPSEEKHRFIYAREQQLDQTLRQIDGVVDAAVYLSVPDKDPISEKPAVGSASVVIIATPKANIDKQMVDIKSVVMNGTQGLTDPDRVSVTSFVRKQAELPASGSRPAALGGVVGWGFLIAVAALAVLLAALVLWRNRRTLTGAKSVRGLHGKRAGGNQ